jgi:hypothetical protein
MMSRFRMSASNTWWAHKAQYKKHGETKDLLEHKLGGIGSGRGT